MKKGLGFALLVIGAITTIWGFVSRNGDRYKEEVFFDGFYGSETMNTVHTMIAVGIIMMLVGLILLALKSEKNSDTLNDSLRQNINKYSNTPEASGNDEQDISTNAVVTSGISPLLRRAELFLEDGDFDLADEYFNRVLDIDPECAKAYIGRMLVELKLKSEDELAGCKVDITKYNNYNKAVRFADNKYKEKLEQFNPEAMEKKEIDRIEATYNNANEMMNRAKTKYENKMAADLFRSIIDYKDSADLADICDERVKNIQAQYDKEIEEELEQEQVANEQRVRKSKIIVGVIAIIIIILIAVNMVQNIVIPSINYYHADQLFENKKYDEASFAFSKLYRFKDSKDRIRECKYEKANSLMANKKYDQAITLYKEISDYKDSLVKIQECHYSKALSLFESKQYNEAIIEFELVENYRDSKSKVMECHYSKAVSLYDNKQYDEAAIEFNDLLGYKDSYDKLIECHYNMGVSFFENKQYVKAAKELILVVNNSSAESIIYKECSEMLQVCNSVFTTYTNKDFGFSISYPADIDIDEGNLNQYNEIYFSSYNPHLYMQISMSPITIYDSIENSYEIKLNEVTNEETDVYYKYLVGNEFFIYWRTSETEYYYRGVFDNQRDIAYFIYLDYGIEDHETFDVTATKIMNSFKILD